ncbi:glycosyltransferase, partial [Methanococcoides sp. SA1]|nr:glycosyltransferase [Methanococcoides sp. SA1]
MQPKISIVIPVYNAERYLNECMDSIIGQSLKDIEIICVVNGSTDSSLEILEAYAKKDHRIILIEKEIADVGGARNTGVNAASGEYLMFIDSDDWIKLEACEKLYGIAKEHDLDILQGDFINIPKKYFRDFKCKHELINRNLSGLDFWNINKNITGMNWDKIWKRNFFVDDELYNPEGIYFEDVITSVKGFTL